MLHLAKGLKPPVPKGIEPWGYRVLKGFNVIYDAMANKVTGVLEKPQVLENEGIKLVFLLLGRKQYVNILLEPKDFPELLTSDSKAFDMAAFPIATKGCEWAKRARPPFVRRWMKEWVDDMMMTGLHAVIHRKLFKPQQYAQRLSQFIRGKLDTLGQLPVSDFVLTSQLKPLHEYKTHNAASYLATQLVNDGLLEVTPGMRLPFVYVKGKKKISRRAMHPSQLQSPKWIDRAHYLKTLRTDVKKAFQFLGKAFDLDDVFACAQREVHGISKLKF